MQINKDEYRQNIDRINKKSRFYNSWYSFQWDWKDDYYYYHLEDANAMNVLNVKYFFVN